MLRGWAIICGSYDEGSEIGFTLTGGICLRLSDTGSTKRRTVLFQTAGSEVASRLGGEAYLETELLAAVENIVRS